MTEMTPSKWWYLLPIFFNIIGGIIAYILLRSKDERMAKNMLYIGAAMAVVVFLFNSPSHVADTVDRIDVIQTTPAEQISTPARAIATPAPTTATVSEYQDSEYNDWLTQVSFNLYNDLNMISTASNRSDLISMKTYYGLLNEDATKALSEIDQFNVSPAMQPAQTELKLALSDLKQAGAYGKRGTENMDVDDMNICVEYMTSANEHLAQASN